MINNFYRSISFDFNENKGYEKNKIILFFIHWGGSSLKKGKVVKLK